MPVASRQAKAGPPPQVAGMREFGVRRYGDTSYRHCLADSPAAAANWFAHKQDNVKGKDFQALVLDLALPLEAADPHKGGGGGNPQTVFVKHGPLTDAGKSAVDLDRTSPLR